jgi:hypothetical protein
MYSKQTVNCENELTKVFNSLMGLAQETITASIDPEPEETALTLPISTLRLYTRFQSSIVRVPILSQSSDFGAT